MNRRAGVAALAAALLVSACGIGADDAPRDIPAPAQLPLGGADSQAGATAGAARVYLLAPAVAGQSTLLQAVARDVEDTALEVLPALFAGPNAGESVQQFSTALPDGLVLLSADRRGTRLVVDISEDIQQLSGQALVLAVAQIVLTAAELPGIRSVDILVEGDEQQWPAGNGEAQSDPLTVYDYPGLVRSAQPAYPAIPTAGE
jgi:spore germination protein GerM